MYSVNVDKKGLKEKRDRLRRDRFKEKDRPTSKYEEVTIKKLREKIARKKVLAKKKMLQKPKSLAEEEELVDVWGQEDNTSKKIQKFKNFSEKIKVNVKAVIIPHGGQSYNPSAKDH